ncbi:MAG: 50S ribosomal protein L21 [Pseudomonadota bacterium]|nr:50S ribosomal protein L21 [Pseudomonadota bacterium]
MTIIFQNRGKQYKVKVGDTLKLPRFKDLKNNDPIVFKEIVFFKNEKGESYLGSPLISGISVKAQVVEQIRDKKIVVFKKKRRHNYRRKIGHRQDLTLVKIKEINHEKVSNMKEKKENKKNLESQLRVKKGDSNGT